MRNMNEAMEVERFEDEMAAANMRRVTCYKCKAQHFVHVSWLEPSDEYCDCDNCKGKK